MRQCNPMTDAQMRPDDARRAAIGAEAQARANATGKAHRVRHRFGAYIVEPHEPNDRADCNGSFVAIFEPIPAKEEVTVPDPAPTNKEPATVVLCEHATRQAALEF